MKTLILAAIRCSLMFTAVTAPLFCVRTAEAYTVRLQQMGANVVANGSGPINLTGLAFVGPFGPAPGIRGNLVCIMAGAGAGDVAVCVEVKLGVTGRLRVGKIGSVGSTNKYVGYIGIVTAGWYY